MSWISEIFSSSVGEVVGKIGEAADALVTSDEERIKLKNELMSIQLKAQLDMQKQSDEYEKEVSKRWVSDNEHFITRLVRPAIVIWSFVMLTAVMLMDGNIGTFEIKEAYIPLLETVVVTAVVAYMGSRGAEKITRTIRGQ